MTLKEIAAEAGVSISTVSRVINKSTRTPAGKEVQDRIWEIVRRTGYTPNHTARELKKGSSVREEPLSRSLPVSLPGWRTALLTVSLLLWQEV